MKEIIINNDNLKEEDINRLVKRAKIIIVNSKEEILLAYSDMNYHLIGGHVENEETYHECLIREIKEETGIHINLKEQSPILTIKYYIKNYPEFGINSKYIHNYYSTKYDLIPEPSKFNLTEEEFSGNFKLRYIHKDKVLTELEKSLETCTEENKIKDTIEAIKEYLKNESFDN